MKCEYCGHKSEFPICDDCVAKLPPKARAAVEDAKRVWLAERAWQDAEQRKADRPLYMYEADEERWTVYGSTLRLQDIEFLIQQRATLQAQDGVVSTRGLQYLLDDTAELRAKWSVATL